MFIFSYKRDILGFKIYRAKGLDVRAHRVCNLFSNSSEKSHTHTPHTTDHTPYNTHIHTHTHKRGREKKCGNIVILLCYFLQIFVKLKLFQNKYFLK